MNSIISMKWSISYSNGVMRIWPKPIPLILLKISSTSVCSACLKLSMFMSIYKRIKRLGRKSQIFNIPIHRLVAIQIDRFVEFQRSARVNTLIYFEVDCRGPKSPWFGLVDPELIEVKNLKSFNLFEYFSHMCACIPTKKWDREVSLSPFCNLDLYPPSRKVLIVNVPLMRSLMVRK